MAAYGAGFVRTSEAADALAMRSASRRRPPLPPRDGEDAAASGPASLPTVTSPSASGMEASATRSSPAAYSASRLDTPAAGFAPMAATPAQGGATTLAFAPRTADVPASAVPGAAPATTSPAPVAPPPAPASAAASVATPPTPTMASEAPAAADSATRSGAKWKDGTFSGWGTSRHGDIEATVIIEKGRITAAAISRCLTRYSCSWIAHLQPQVVERQSPEVDNVSGATESANAFYYAVVEALKTAKP